ncbi:MAG: hypothetical protein EKK37_10785 [Sphingobacteriales bacterium]|nr:MAG: hypothetical protein EKK37_10785 [Sphingobacteriales bacterium]
MENQKKRGAVVYGDEINPSQFNYSDKEINELSSQLDNIKSYATKEINQENFQELCDAWHKIIAKIPFASIPVEVEWLLRARPNFNGEIFEDEFDISYNSKNIKDIKASRFNRPEESVFYGTLPSDDQTKFIAGASLECYKELISDKNDEPIQYFTFGKWHLINKFPVINLCFEEKALKAHPGLKRVVDNYLENLEKDFPHESALLIKECWFLLSKLASVRYEYDQQYFITTAFFCVIREYYKIYYDDLINGIIYPSSMVDGDAVNIVLVPEAVNKYLYLKQAFMYKYVRSIDNKRSYDCGLGSLISEVVDHKLNIMGIKYGRDIY